MAHGAIDVPVCNAGIGSATQGDDLIAIEAVRRTMAKSTSWVLSMRAAAALPSLQATHGLIVAVSSLQGLAVGVWNSPRDLNATIKGAYLFRLNMQSAERDNY